jgi:hypothetical protein
MCRSAEGAAARASAFLLDRPGLGRYLEAMSSQPLSPAAERPGRTRSGTLGGRAAALVEVVLAFCLVHLAYRSFKHFTRLGRLEVASGVNFSPGTTMILFTVVVLLLRGRDFGDYGLTRKGWRYNLNVGLLGAGVVGGAVVLVLAVAPVRLDPLHPPDLPKAAVSSCGAAVLTLLLALFLGRDRPSVRRVPVTVTLLVVGGLLCLPLVVAACSGRPLPGVLLSVLWLFLGAGFGEEVFFRGYVQSWVNGECGRPRSRDRGVLRAS